MTEFTFSGETYKVSGKNKTRADVDREGAARLARTAQVPHDTGITPRAFVKAQVAMFLLDGMPVRIGRHVIEVVYGSFRLWVTPKAHCDDVHYDAFAFAAGGRCARTVSCWALPLERVEADFLHIADAFLATVEADADDLPIEIIEGTRAA